MSVRSNQHDIRSGFTLLELMIVLAILVIIMGVAWPRITGQMQQVAPREAAIQLKSDLSEAREQAVLTGEAWCIRIERGTGQYELGPVSIFREREDLASTTSVTQAGSVEALLGQSAVPSPLESSLAASPSSVSTSGVAPNGTLTQARPRIEELELPVGMVFDDGVAHSTQDVNQVRITDPNQQATPVLPAAQVLPTTPGLPAPTLMPTMPTTVATGPIDSWKYVVIFQPDGRATESEIRLKEVTSEAKIRLRIRGFTGGVTIDGVERKPRLTTTTDPENPLDQLDPDPVLDPSATPLDPLLNPPTGPTTSSTFPPAEVRP